MSVDFQTRRRDVIKIPGKVITLHRFSGLVEKEFCVSVKKYTVWRTNSCKSRTYFYLSMINLYIFKVKPEIGYKMQVNNRAELIGDIIEKL